VNTFANRPALLRRIVTELHAKVSNASPTGALSRDIVLCEGEGLTPHPIWVGVQMATVPGDVS
jgi:hypothetical protein